MTSLAVMKPAPFSDSCTDDIIASIILEMTGMSLFGVGLGVSGRIGNLDLSLR